VTDPDYFVEQRLKPLRAHYQKQLREAGCLVWAVLVFGFLGGLLLGYLIWG
jgi:hypothetical protein